MIKQIPNIFTLLNLVFGCMAIVVCLNHNLVVNTEGDTGLTYITLPENLVTASIYIGIAAVIDFFDGFVARLLKANSNMGKQLDSLADVVSFGVAPSIIVFQFLKFSFAQQENGLDVSTLYLLPAFLIASAGAYRLARFNVDTHQTNSFKGVPIPAVGLLIASYPLVYWYGNSTPLMALLHNKWIWYALILLVSYLMVSTLPMLALKFSNFTLKKIMPFIILLIVIIASALFCGWLCVTVAFVSYIILSIIFKNNS